MLYIIQKEPDRLLRQKQTQKDNGMQKLQLHPCDLDKESEAFSTHSEHVYCLNLLLSNFWTRTQIFCNITLYEAAWEILTFD